MKEVYGNLWDSKADAIIITTNGTIRKDGACVMGRGVALQAAQRDKHLSYVLGALIKSSGNRPFFLEANTDIGYIIITLPVKDHWCQQADIDLIEEGVRYISSIVNNSPVIETIAMPRPGCGNGRLKWEDVKPIIEPYLNDRFTVYNNEKE